MLKNFWWPLEFSEAVTAKPRRVTALMQEFALYRLPDGRAQVLSDLCVHRGGALSDGWTEGGCIVCPYHGWWFESDGACVKIPANQPGVPVPKKARVDSYPTIERYGYVWAYLGSLPEAERPPFPEFTAPEGDGTVRTTGIFERETPHENLLAAVLDTTTAPFRLSAAEPVDPPDLAVSRGNFQAVATGETESRITRRGGFLNLARLRSQTRLALRIEMHMPALALVDASLPGERLVLAAALLPVQPGKTIVKWTVWQTGTGAAPAEEIVRRVENILGADIPDTDGGLIPHYDAMAAEASAAGWVIDTHRIQTEFARQQAVVIPSPARQEIAELAKAWVMKEVPVKNHSKEQTQ